jgi:hypothetical protein
MDSIGKIGMTQDRDSISIWRVCLPGDVDREVYIKTCYLTGRISLINDNGEVKHRVKVGKLAIQLIDFPNTTGTFGSEVACLTMPYSGELYVADVYQSSSNFADQKEYQYRFVKSNGEEGIAALIIDGKGKISLTVDGEDSDAGIDIKVTSVNKSAKLNLNVNGDIVVQNQGTVSVTSDREIRFITEGKIYLNQSDEPILLGNKTTELLSDLLDQLAKESAGPYPLLGQSIYPQIKQRLDELKSTISFVK